MGVEVGSSVAGGGAVGGGGDEVAATVAVEVAADDGVSVVVGNAVAVRVTVTNVFVAVLVGVAASAVEVGDEVAVAPVDLPEVLVGVDVGDAVPVGGA